MINEHFKTLKIGLIGIGEQMRDNLIPVLNLLENVEIVAMCDLKRTNLVPQSINFYTDYYQMLEIEKLDIVIVASYPEIHEKVLEFCILKNINVFVEKPPTYTLQKLQELTNLFEKNSKKPIIGFGMNFNYAKSIQKIDQFILQNKKEVGEIEHIRIAHLASKPNEYTFWKMTNLLDCFLLSQAIHPLALANKYINKEVKVRDTSYLKDNSIYYSLDLDVANDLKIKVFATNNSPYFSWDFTLITSNKFYFHIDQNWTLKIKAPANFKNLSNEKIEINFLESPIKCGHENPGYYDELATFVECVRNKTEFREDLYFMENVYKLMYDR